ncbi:MAG: YfhO family protein [Planctomycetia bacterium]|nr:YfhO family protein [Planctomycetia bacterium]
MATASIARPRLLTATLWLASGLLLLAMAWPAMHGKVYIADDLGAFHLPARAFYSEALHHGDRFDWWPQLYNGFYLTGEGQVGTYHPLHLVLYRFFPLPVAFNLELLLSYPFLFIGAWLWLRRQFANRDAALFGALLWTFSGFNLLHLAHLNAVAVMAHLPWLLMAIDVAVTDPRRRARAVATAAVPLLTASQLLLGYPQYVWFSLLAECGYTWWLLHRMRRAGIAPSETIRPGESKGFPTAVQVAVQFAAAVAIGFLIAGVQLLPTLDALQSSVRRTADSSFAEWGSLHPWNLLQLVAPYLFRQRVVGLNTHELGLYAGCVPLALCAWLWVRRNELGSLRPLVIVTAWLAVLSLWWAAGEYGYIYRFQTWLPVVGKFRFPCRAIVLFHLATAVLSAAALALLAMQHPSRVRLGWKRFSALWGILVLSLLTIMLALCFWRPYVAGWQAVTAGPLLIGAAVGLVWLADRNHRWALAALALLAAADLGFYGLSYSTYGQTAELTQLVDRCAPPPPGATPRLLAEPPAFDLKAARVGNRALLSGWSRVGGYAGLEPASTLDYHQLAALRVAGVGWVCRTPQTDAMPGLVPYNELLLRVEHPLDDARLVTQVRPSKQPGLDLPEIDPSTTALASPAVAHRLALPSGPSKDIAPGNVEIVTNRPGRETLTTQAATPQLLVLSQRWHNGWQATVNGQSAAVEQVNGDFMGCLVPAGQSRVELAFRPASLRYGLWLSGCGLGLWVLGFAWLWRGRTAPVGLRAQFNATSIK